jgi:hypothetical protein
MKPLLVHNPAKVFMLGTVAILMIVILYGFTFHNMTYHFFGVVTLFLGVLYRNFFAIYKFSKKLAILSTLLTFIYAISIFLVSFRLIGDDVWFFPTLLGMGYIFIFHWQEWFLPRHRQPN